MSEQDKGHQGIPTGPHCICASSQGDLSLLWETFVIILNYGVELACPSAPSPQNPAQPWSMALLQVASGSYWI